MSNRIEQRMETRQQRLIREALEHDTKLSDDADPPPKTSLQDKSLEHTDPDYLPRTLTPFEWEEFYAEHGVPREHRRQRARDGNPKKRSFLRRLLRR